jgi:prepilin-type processing-associated H-X9-DG protein
MYHRGARGESAWQIDRADESVTIDFARSMAMANGVFNNKVRAIGTDGNLVAVGPGVSLADFTDGQGYTVLFSENLQAMPWHRAGLIAAQDLVISDDSNQFRYEETSRYTQGMVWHFEDQAIENARGVNPVHLINGPPPRKDIFVQRMNATNAPHLARPSSAHSKGVNVAMADGSTRFVSETIDYRVYQALLTPNGAGSDVPYPEFMLGDGSLLQ